MKMDSICETEKFCSQNVFPNLLTQIPGSILMTNYLMLLKLWVGLPVVRVLNGKIGIVLDVTDWISSDPK